MRIRIPLAILAAGAGLVLAPAAEAAPAPARPDNGTSIVSSAPGKGTKRGELGGQVKSGSAHGDTKATKGKASPHPRRVRCWNGRTSGRSFYETCSGRRYRPYVDCSNHYRYYSRIVFSGTWNHKLTCPPRTRAIWGGARG